MLFYSQTSGTWTDETEKTLVTGCYAGNGADMNNPGDQFVVDHGPIPQGFYTLEPLQLPHDPAAPHLGPSMKIVPDPGNDMEGRGGFYGHLRNPARPLDSSDGCIVFLDLAHLEVIEAQRAAGQARFQVTA